MKTLNQLCIPRQSAFERGRRDEVLDLTNLIEDNIKPREFFDENYLTDGMKSLFREAFRRFAGNSASGVIKLTQAMGGGKTHCMIALGLLARYPELRKEVMGEDYNDEVLGTINVVAFTGRENPRFGIWGSLAEQLGKKDVFKDCYSPLQAPGMSEWVNLLKGEPLLILLDELPPYLENARSHKVGNSDLSVVTVTAVSNLMVAVGKEELSNVCIVISDLKATYESGTEGIHSALSNFENEVGRVAINLEPVGLNTDEVYHILKKRLFEQIPDDEEIMSIAEGYAKAIKEAGQMDITQVSPDKFIRQIRESYPFHPAIKDLYARFRENPGFQQTRGLIRFMRLVVSNIFKESGSANSRYLIHPHDIDLNDSETLAEITRIKPNIDIAISHDIASKGSAVAEMLDHEWQGSDAQDVCKVLLVASLANIQNAVLGLTPTEVMADICAPDRDITTLPAMVEKLETQLCWYLHKGRDGRLHFKITQNLVAKLRSTAEAYGREASLKELKSVLNEIFIPERKDCYQDVLVLPAVDEIHVVPDKVKLILYEPCAGGLHTDLRVFYEDLDYKNRVLFLSGERDTLDSLLEVGKEYKAIQSIQEELASEGDPDDPQRTIALDLKENITFRLLSAARETFTTLTYPHGDELHTTDLMMIFQNNECRGEEQIRDALKSKQKFTEDVSSDTFRKKCEQRLFTRQEMLWSEVKSRAAINTAWQWHHLGALNSLKDAMVSKDQWCTNGKYVDKGPFPEPTTDVHIQELHRDDDTGEVTLKITPVHGDAVYYDVGSEAAPGSARVEDLHAFKTSEMNVSFLCMDPSGQHETGEPVAWKNKLTLKKRVYGNDTEKSVELRSAPLDAVIRYTTDGSNPRTSGAIYENPFTVLKGTKMVLAIAENNGSSSEQLKVNITWGNGNGEFTLNPGSPTTWKHEHKQTTTKESFELIECLKKYEGEIFGPSISIAGDKWIDLVVDKKMHLDVGKIEGLIDAMREVCSEGQVHVVARSLWFPTGQKLTDFAADEKKDIDNDEVEQ
uniref:GH29D-like beta-sandwich domain-containing protein n=1 Tax=Candidatus Methanogaster sp. ANME-2c ERB4 TaxID=2759911 RepID=A0A7G9YGH6_9EURY|nr:hypothetical protein PLINODHC_00004 [Methanosarcinales archaeon ANME-2c ERB4]